MTLGLFAGSTGRLGRLLNNLSSDSTRAFILRNGDIVLNEKIIGNIYTPFLSLDEQVYFCDTAIDYSSIENLIVFEEVKRNFIKYLRNTNRLKWVLSISSGAVEFDDDLFQSEFYLKYKHEKIKLEKFLYSLDVPYFCPRIYTLIGSSSYSLKSIGWVDVINQVKNSKVVKVSDPESARTWVSEYKLSQVIQDFFTTEENFGVFTPVSGTFKLIEVINIAEDLYNKKVTLEMEKKSNWLSVPYVANNYVSIESDLRREIEKLVVTSDLI